VVLRAPENCGGSDDSWTSPDIVNYCAVKDVFGALGGPSSGTAATDFVATANRFEFSQPVDCNNVGPVADGKHDDCAVVTGAATLLRAGLPVRLFGVCARPVAKDCAVLGTITDPNWTPAGVYMLMDPAQVHVQCQYAQNADRNGCNEHGAYTAGRQRPLCSANPADRMCQYGSDEQDEMLAAFNNLCTKDPTNCLENQLEAQWGPESIVAIGYVKRGEQPNDCARAREKATAFAAAINKKWSANLPIVQVYLDVANNQVAFTDAAAGCEVPD
jgi:hypothetical protein